MARSSNVIEYIKSDLYRRSGSCRLKAFLLHFLLDRSFKYMFWFRIASRCTGALGLVGLVMHRHLSLKYGIQIPRRTQIGFGFYIGHHMGIVIHPSAKIGDNCNISQFTTIGSNHGAAATIEDEVYLGPSVCVVENITIGRRACIGAGSVVVNDIPPNTTAVGVPARVVNNTPKRYIINRWPPGSA